MDLIDAIRARRSVRTFDGTSLGPALLGELSDYAGSLENPFHIPIEFRVLDADEHGLSSPVILGARTYVAAKVVRQPHAEEAFGYAFERLILHATSLGLGTVWLAGTIDRPAFERAMEVGEDEVMPAVSPIGHAAPKRSVRESAMRRALRSDGRMAFGELFFENDFSSPLPMNAGGLNV